MDDEICSGGRSLSHCSCLCTPPDWAEHLLARDVMQYGVLSIDEKEPIHLAVKILAEHDISGVPVTHRGRLKGMVSGKDLLAVLYKSAYLPGLARDYMTSDVISANVDTKLSVVHKHLVEHSFRRVPICCRGRLVGMITRADLVSVYMERFRPAPESSDETSRDGLLAEDVMKHGLLTVGPDAPLYDAMYLIARHHITGLPVVDEDMNLLGIITEKDLLDCVGQPGAAGAAVGACMVRDVIAFDRRTSLRRICLCLIEKDFHRVPILDGTHLVGIISRSDILRYRTAIFKC